MHILHFQNNPVKKCERNSVTPPMRARKSGVRIRHSQSTNFKTNIFPRVAPQLWPMGVQFTYMGLMWIEKYMQSQKKGVVRRGGGGRNHFGGVYISMAKIQNLLKNQFLLSLLIGDFNLVTFMS